MRKVGASMLVALAGMLTTASGVLAGHCGGATYSCCADGTASAEQSSYVPCKATTKTVFKIVKETVPVKVMRDACKEVEVTTYKMVPKTVYKDVMETVMQDVEKTCHKKVSETCYKDVTYTVCKRCTRPA